MDPRTNHKDRILELIRENPFVSQQEMARRLRISRSSVAGHITQLVRDGRLLGRAYLLPMTEPILVAGGANLDRVAKSFRPVAPATSNPVSVQESFGGVARNVAENLARLGLPVRLMTMVGDDSSGAALLKQARELGIDVSASLTVQGRNTGTYTALLQPDGELVLGMADMGVLESFTVDFLRKRRHQWTTTRWRVADCNLPAEVLAELIQDSHRRKANLVIVGVSEPKMDRLPSSLKGVTALILNRGQLAVRSGRRLRNRAAVLSACRKVQTQGAKGVVVTLGPEGAVGCWDREEPIHLSAPKVRVVDVTGAGDAFSSGVIASLVSHPEDLPRACRLGQHLAALTLASRSSVAPDLSPALLQTFHPSDSRPPVASSSG